MKVYFYPLFVMLMIKNIYAEDMASVIDKKTTEGSKVIELMLNQFKQHDTKLGLNTALKLPTVLNNTKQGQLDHPYSD